MAQNLADYLYRAAIRMLRSNWPETRPFAEEWYTILRGIEPGTTGPISFTPDDGDPVEFPEVDDLNIPPFDLDFPEDGINEPETNLNGTTSTEETYFWHRAVFPGQVISQDEGVNYNITVHPNGALVTKSEGKFGFDTPNEPATKDITARSLNTGIGPLAAGTWLYVYWVAEYLLTEETHRNGDGAIISRTTDLQVVQQEYLFIPPETNRLAVVTSEISAGSDSAPGQGTATFRTFDATEGTYVEGDSFTVYNSVESSVPAGKKIHVTPIDGVYFVNVEDCSS